LQDSSYCLSAKKYFKNISPEKKDGHQNTKLIITHPIFMLEAPDFAWLLAGAKRTALQVGWSQARIGSAARRRKQN